MARFNLSILILFLVSCSNPKSNSEIRGKNDTVKIIELAIRTAFDHENLPGISPLKYNYRFNDSILFTSDVLLLSYLPQTVDSISFKILSKNQISAMLIADSNELNLPNYLSIADFEKNDTGYYVNIKSLSCFPFGEGGSCGIYITDNKGSFLVSEKHSWSIN